MATVAPGPSRISAAPPWASATAATMASPSPDPRAPRALGPRANRSKAVGAKSFIYERGPEVQDDHLALNRAGIPTVDVIDFDYPHWHKLTDTADKVDGAQMAEVAKVMTAWLQKIK